jgi:hypothetical protein
VADYRIDFTVQVCEDGSGDYVEIGFGSGSGGTVDSAAYAVETMLQRREWETMAGQPDPRTVGTGDE